MNLTSIPRGQVAPGSACLIAAVPEEWIDTIPQANPISGFLEQDITLSPGRAWLRLILTSRKRTLRHTTQRNTAGITYPVTIAGTTVGTSSYLHNLLAIYELHRWVLLYTEAGTGITYLIGRPQAGAIITADYNNTQATQHSLTINYTGTQKTPVYQGSYTLDNDVTVSPEGGSIGVAFYTASGTESPANVFTLPALTGRTLLWVSRAGMEDLTPVPNTPLPGQVQWNPLTATGTLHPDFPLSANEKLTILYR